MLEETQTDVPAGADQVCTNRISLADPLGRLKLESGFG